MKLKVRLHRAGHLAVPGESAEPPSVGRDQEVAVH